MKFLLGLFLFSVLLTTGASLECETCKGVANCTGAKELCREDLDACSSSLLESSSVADKFMTKGCANSDVCVFEVLSVTYGNGSHIRQIFSCCLTYGCDPAAPILPERKTRANGKICPGCSSQTGDCSPEVTECIGSDTECISYVTLSEMDAITSSMKGCIRKSTCDQLKTYDGGVFNDPNSIKNVQCTPAMAAASSSPLCLPLPFGFLLLALLLRKFLLS